VAGWEEPVAPRIAASLEAAIEQLGSIPVFDRTVMKVISLCEEDEASTTAITAVIETDSGFAANLMRFVNSAHNASPIRAKTVRQAVTILGRTRLRRLALEACTFRFLEEVPGNGHASRGQMHVHAVNVAAASARVAELAGVPAETPHLAGLLHDIGKLVLPLVAGERTVDVIAEQQPSGGGRALLEREHVGIDHAQAGAMLARRWGIAEDVVDAIAWHHGGAGIAEAPSDAAACVQLANAVVNTTNGHRFDGQLMGEAVQRLRLAPDVLDELAVSAAEVTRAPSGPISEAVGELERLARTDDLTGLANRRHWLKTTREGLAAGVTGAIVLCDVDYFKQINDAHGHAAGDAVLIEVAGVLARHGRAGRLGGDEFALWIAGGVEEARTTVSRVMSACRDCAPSIGVSLGVALAPAHGVYVDDLLEAADAALYRAKHAGRSRAFVAGEQLAA
jgi:diguanylate cyclase (GGDEF)-like protein/putative nucleotidyltransferase with HDIG domain